MERAAVGFDHQALRPPEEVGLVGPAVSGDPGVHGGRRNAGVSYEGEEELFELAVGKGRLGKGGEQAPEHTGAAPRSRPLQRVLDGHQVEEAKHLRLINRPLDDALGLRVAQVDERPRDGRAGDAVHVGVVRCSEGGAGVDPDAGSPPSGRRRPGHVDQGSALGQQAVLDRGRTVGQHRARAAGEHGSHAAACRGEVRAPDGIDADVDPKQPAVSRPPRHGRLAQPERGELPGRDDAVLRPRELDDRRLTRKLST